MKVTFAVQLLCIASALKIDTMNNHHHHHSHDYAETDNQSIPAYAEQPLDHQWTLSLAQQKG